MLWEVDIYPAAEQPDRVALDVAREASDLGLADAIAVSSARGYLIEGAHIGRDQLCDLARQLLADTVVERFVVDRVGADALQQAPEGQPHLVYVLLKPGVMDPEAESALKAIGDFGVQATAVRTLSKYWIGPLSRQQLERLANKVLANDAIQQVHYGPLPLDRIQPADTYRFTRTEMEIAGLDDRELKALSRRGQLYLQLAEMHAIQDYFRNLDRAPTDIELETIAQTWSEHCSHKTLAGRIDYRDERQQRTFHNMLKETIFAATQRIREELASRDWCVSVFRDNAGVVRFDEHHHVVFKVETHNHPSAIEPYGGANTGLGGVLRDTMGTGLGAKPVASTNVFCVAPPDTPHENLPPGVLHPRRVLKGVVAGVRDYGNRMGIPTVNGALYFDQRYLGNPLVYCGSVGILPADKSFKKAHSGDWIVTVGGRTGRDGIHGATFSSAELTSQSEALSGGAVQIGNAITEKMMADVLLEARDRGLFHAITDCGAGGFSSAVGEMGAEIGAEVWLERPPLKYAGLSYTEIWISEAQERMVLSVSPDHWDALRDLCASEGVEATIIGRFAPTGRLLLKYGDHIVGDLSMEFLHEGRPPVIRPARYVPRDHTELPLPDDGSRDATQDVLRILGMLNVASKEWVIRQYDHEVQGGSVLKPLVGTHRDGPGDAAIIRPRLDSHRGIVVACGMNPHYGDIDTYAMAAGAIDEAVRNCVAVGADPRRVALLDNFCWGNCEHPETLGSLVRAALACHDVAVALQTPFISGKDSLNNEYHYEEADGRRTAVSIPASLLISALGQIDDVDEAVSMDFKQAGNRVFLVGLTQDELGGSHWSLMRQTNGGRVPRVDPLVARSVFAAVHDAIRAKLVRACHDLSEGGLAVAAAEMAFSGMLGTRLHLDRVPNRLDSTPANIPLTALETILLFSESHTRFLCEVPGDHAQSFGRILGDLPHADIGEVTDTSRLQFVGLPRPASTGTAPPLVVDEEITELKRAWQSPLSTLIDHVPA